MSSAATRSVKVPPVSMPMRQATSQLLLVLEAVMDLVGLGDGNASLFPQALPDGRQRRRMGVRGALSDLDDGGCPAAPPRPARGLRRAALDRAGRRTVAHAAP